MASFEFLAVILTGLGLTASIVYYSTILSNANKTRELQLQAQEHATETRQAQMFMDLYKQFNDPDFVKRKRRVANFEFTSYEEYDKKYGPESNSEAYDDHFSVAAFFEGIGILVKRGLIDDMMSESVLSFWGKYRDVFYKVRRKYNYPTSAEHVEYLYESVKKIVEEQHGKEVASRYEPNP